MPICTRDGFEAPKNTSETFHDNEMVFYCETTKKIFRDYEEYFRHIMLINSTIWQCEETGRENLTYAEAMYSEKKARKKMETFKDCLRAPTLIAIEKAQQAAYKDIFNIVYNLLRERFFLNEIVQAVITSSAASYHECKIIDIIKPSIQTNDNHVYEPSTLSYKLQKLTGVQTDATFIVPAQNIKRSRIEFGRDNLQLFIKDSVHRVQGLIKPKPDAFKKYVTDRNIDWSKIFVGSLPNWMPAKPRTIAAAKKKINSTNKKLIQNGENEKKIKQSSMSKYVKDVDQAVKLKQEQSLREQMELARKEKERKMAEFERKRAEILLKIEEDIKIIARKTDDLERVDQKVLPFYNPIESLVPVKYFGDFLYIQEFLHSFAGILSGTDAFNKNISFFEMTRAFTVHEVAGPMADIVSVLLSTIFALQIEEEDECSIEYIKPKIYLDSDLWSSIRNATQSHLFVRKHLSNKIHDLPLDSQTISEVLRLHLLSSGANTDEKSDKWRFMYRNGYSISEDPGLKFCSQYPHILRALKMYSIYQLPFVDIFQIINCLIAQILSYSSSIGVIEERAENAIKSRSNIRTAIIAENKRTNLIIMEKKKLLQEYNLKIIEGDIKLNEQQKKRTHEELLEKIKILDGKIAEGKKTFEKEVLNEHANIFNFMVLLGTDRAYRNYYVFESISGIFIEHPLNTYDDICLENPTKNWQEIVDIPKNRRDLQAFLKKHYDNLEKLNQNVNKLDGKSDKDLEADKENLEKLSNGKLNGSIVLNGDIKIEPINSLNSENNVEHRDVAKQPPTQSELYMCTGKQSDCLVHNSKNPNRNKWSFIYLESELEALISSLNPLGERESHLRDQLLTYKPLLLNHIKSCPIDYITLSKDMRKRRFQLQMNTETNRRYATSNIAQNINEVMYTACAEKILQLEVDTTTGCLGKMKVNNLEQWRQNLLDNKYDSQVELIYGTEDCNKLIDPGEHLGNTIDIESEDSADEEITNYDSPELKQSVQNLASALLQVEQSIEQKFFKAPFGLQNEIRDKIERQNQLAKLQVKLKHWEESLMNSTNYSSIFLHLSILYDSIKWNRSTNRSCCIVCRRKGEPEKMLLCDECNAGTHMFCLKPKLKQIPEGNWYCRRCVQQCGFSNNIETERKSKRRRFVDADVQSNSSKLDDENDEYLPDEAKRKRKSTTTKSKKEEISDEEKTELYDNELEFENDDIDNNSNDEKTIDENDDDNELNDEECDDEDNEEETEEEGTQDENDDDEAACNICSYNGCEISCSVCSLDFHLDCVQLKRNPRGVWKCSKCKIKEDKKRKVRESYSSESSTDSEEPLVKRSKRIVTNSRNTGRRTSARTSKSKIDEIDDGPKYNNNNRRSRRSGDNLPLNGVVLYDLLDSIFKNENSWPFLRPVLQSEVPDYYTIIKRPMDFAKIKSKLNMAQYRINEEILNDIQLVFKNCDTYNREGNEIYNAGASLEKFIIKRCKELNLPFRPSDMNAS